MPREPNPVQAPTGFDAENYKPGSDDDRLGDAGEDVDKLEDEVVGNKEIDVSYLDKGFNQIVGFVKACSTNEW